MLKESFKNKQVAVTGKLENYTRSGIQTRLLELGAKPISTVSRRTDILIVGAKSGSKLDKAKALGTKILSEKEFEDMAGNEEDLRYGNC